jgi:hypothetical protein
LNEFAISYFKNSVWTLSHRTLNFLNFQNDWPANILAAAQNCECGTTLAAVNFGILYDARLFIQGGSNMTGTNCDLFTHK